MILTNNSHMSTAIIINFPTPQIGAITPKAPKYSLPSKKESKRMLMLDSIEKDFNQKYVTPKPP